MSKRELRQELRKTSDEQLCRERSDANLSITRGMLLSRAGVNATYKFIAEIEKEQTRRAQSDREKESRKP